MREGSRDKVQMTLRILLERLDIEFKEGPDAWPGILDFKLIQHGDTLYCTSDLTVIQDNRTIELW